MDNVAARQMLGQRQTLGLALPRDRRRHARVGGRARLRRFNGLQLLELQLELVDHARQALRRLAELHAAQLGQLRFELLDLERGQLD